jgi:hypothetical protein
VREREERLRGMRELRVQRSEFRVQGGIAVKPFLIPTAF